MKNLKFVSLTTLILAVVIWTVFYLVMPDAPLTAAETGVVVLVCLVFAVIVRAVWALARGRRTTDHARDQG